MAAGLTDHRWTMEELLSYRIPLAWIPTEGKPLTMAQY
jgi:hypothetical protein